MRVFVPLDERIDPLVINMLPEKRMSHRKRERERARERESETQRERRRE